jgi:hypothetical protein
MAVVAVLGLLALLSDVRRFDGVLLWALGGTTGAWLVVDHQHEIAVPWSLTANHGLTVADLAAIPSVLVALALGDPTAQKRASIALTDPPLTIRGDVRCQPRHLLPRVADASERECPPPSSNGPARRTMLIRCSCRR